jgi:hypothetical protein
MPENGPPSQQTKAAMEALEQAFRNQSAADFALLDLFAQAEAERARRLTAAESLLAKAPDQDANLLSDLRLERDQSAKFARGVTALLRRVQGWPRPESGQIAILGQVVNAAGAPVQGVTAQLSGPTAQQDRRIGKARTNEMGDFALLVGVCELEVRTGQEADWQIVVVNAKGETVAAKTVALDPSGDQISFVPIQLSVAPAKT